MPFCSHNLNKITFLIFLQQKILPLANNWSILTLKIVTKLLENMNWIGYRTRDPGIRKKPSRIWIWGVKKAPKPGFRIRNTVWFYVSGCDCGQGRYLCLGFPPGYFKQLCSRKFPFLADPSVTAFLVDYCSTVVLSNFPRLKVFWVFFYLAASLMPWLNIIIFNLISASIISRRITCRGTSSCVARWPRRDTSHSPSLPASTEFSSSHRSAYTLDHHRLSIFQFSRI